MQLSPATPHVVDAQLDAPSSYLTVQPGDRVFDLYGWQVGSVAEPRIAATRDEFFDGLVVELAGERVFVDAPEVRAIHHGAVVLDVTLADLARARRERLHPARDRCAAASPEDAVALSAAFARLYATDGLSLTALERAVERVLAARSCAELDAIAAELLPLPPG